MSTLTADIAPGPPAAVAARRGVRPEMLVAALAFFVSGASGLVYQVAWQRILALHSGIGIYSIAMIVGAFMAGLGVGSHVGGGISLRVDARRSLRLFALVELAIGIFGALSCWLYYDLLYLKASWLYTPAWRAGLLHFAGLFVPTFLMGTSLPFLVRAMVSEVRTAGRTVGILYGINLLGAAFGSVLTPWVLIRVFGIRHAVYAAAAGNVVAAVLGLVAGYLVLRAPRVDEDEPRGVGRRAPARALPLPPVARAVRAQRLLRAGARDPLVPGAGDGGEVHRLHLRDHARAVPARLRARLPHRGAAGVHGCATRCARS